MLAVAFNLIEVLRLPDQPVEGLLDHRQLILNIFSPGLKKFGLQLLALREAFVTGKVFYQRVAEGDGLCAVSFRQQPVLAGFGRDILGAQRAVAHIQLQGVEAH